MSELKEPEAVKLIMALLFQEPKEKDSLLVNLENKFGIIAWRSPEFEFAHTRYYNEEMGEVLNKCFVGFAQAFTRRQLPEVKLLANQLEGNLSRNGKRLVNIDPGYLTLDRLVLSTRKDAAHRIYLRDEIFAEVTLIYQSGSFQPLPWTYPDYRSPLAIDFFNHIRQAILEEKRTTQKKL